ncbi:MAG: hypothetical protein HY289_03590 [Planctomycetes bacterium]|nr:hypothetical protein [Planctomycetota bacterium]
MTMKTRLLLAGIALAGIAAFILSAGPSQASFLGDDLPAVVKKIAGEIKKGNAAEAKKLSAATVKNNKLIDEMSDLMHMYRPTDKGGLGIENDLKKANAKNAEEVANLVRAMAELTAAKGWAEPKGKRTKKAWNDFADEMRSAADGLAKAKTDKAATEAAGKVLNSCTRCHSVFKDS